MTHTMASVSCGPC